MIKFVVALGQKKETNDNFSSNIFSGVQNMLVMIIVDMP